MSIVIGDILARLRLDSSEWSRNSQRAQKDLKDLQDVSKTVSAELRNTLGGIAAMGGIGVAFTQVIEKYKQFEQQSKNAQVAAQATDAQLKQMQDSAMKLAAEFGDSSASIVAGMGDIIKAGGQLKDVLDGGGEAMVALSKAGEISMADAGETLATVKNVYKDAVGGYSQIANTIVGVGNAAAGSIGDIRMALAQSQAVANGTGQSFNDLVAALGLLHNAGLKGSDAGTSYKTMLQNLLPSTKEATELFKEFGLITADNKNVFFDASGKLKDIASVIDVLKTKFGQFNQQAQSDIFSRLFGSDSSRAALAFMQATTQQINDMRSALTSTSAVDQARDRIDTLNGSIEKSKAAFENMAISIGSIFVPAINELGLEMGAITSLFSQMSDAQKSSASETVKQVVQIGLLATAFGTTYGAVKLVLPAIASATVAMTGLGTAATVAAGPWGAIATVIGLVATAAVGYTVEAEKARMEQQEQDKQIVSLANRYDKLIAVTKSSTASDQEKTAAQQELKSVIKEIGALHPEIIGQLDAEGNAVSLNTAAYYELAKAKRASVLQDLQTDFIKATNDLSAAKQKSANLDWTKVTGPDAGRYLEEQQKALKSVTDAQNKLKQLNAQMAQLNGEASNEPYVDSRANHAKNAYATPPGGSSTTGEKSYGSQSWAAPVDGPKGKSAEDLAREADAAMRESYEASRAYSKQLLDAGQIDLEQYIEREKNTRTAYADWLKGHAADQYRIDNDIAKGAFTYSSEWIAEQKSAMQERGATAAEVAAFEIESWNRVASRENLLAEDRKTALASLKQAQHDAAAASFADSVQWINAKKLTMQDEGKSAIEIADMELQSWERVYARKAQLNAEDAAQARENAESAKRALTQAIAADLKQAREMQRNSILDAQEKANKSAEDAIQAKIDALDREESAQQRLLEIEKDRKRLADLQDQRAKTAADKRFSLIERDASGQLVERKVADLEKLSDLDEQIADQQENIAEKARQGAIKANRDALEKELKDTRDKNSQRLAALKAFYDQWTTDDKVNADTRALVQQNGLQRTLADVEKYLADMKAAYTRVQNEIMLQGSLFPPQSVPNSPNSSQYGPPVPAGSKQSVIDQMNANSARWASATPAEQAQLHDANIKLGDSIGGKYNDKTGQWTFHDGGIVGTRIGGDEVIAKLKIGELVLNERQQREAFGEARKQSALKSLGSMMADPFTAPPPTLSRDAAASSAGVREVVNSNTTNNSSFTFHIDARGATDPQIDKRIEEGVDRAIRAYDQKLAHSWK